MVTNFIDTSSLLSCFYICDLLNKKAILNDSLPYINDDTVIYIHDLEYGNYIYAKGNLYGGASDTDEEGEDFSDDIRELKLDINDIGKFIFDHHEKISKNIDSINTLNNKVENIINSNENEFRTIENSLDVANNFSRLVFDVSVYSSGNTNNSITNYPKFMDEYAVVILKNSLTYDINKMLTYACLTIIKCHNANDLTDEDIIVIPGSFISYITAGHIIIDSEGGGIETDTPSTFIILQLTTSVGIFCRIMDIQVFKTYQFFPWKYYAYQVSKDKILYDAYNE